MGKLWSSGLLLELVSNLLVRWFLEINLGIPTSYFKQVLTMNIKKVSFKISMWKLWSSGTFGNWPLLFSLSISLILSNLSHCGTVKAINLKYRHKHPIYNLPTILHRIIIWKLWQYGLWSFQTGDTKLEIFLPKNQHIQKKLLNFEFWINGKLSKIGHYFSNNVAWCPKWCRLCWVKNGIPGKYV